jgi:predicted nucleic acid-binding protein
VPATLSAYYKQQLKWSRGTFELLFHTYPGLYKKFTWRQKIHYLCIPLYFLFGLINLIDILIPLLALGMAEVPWSVDIENFAVLFVPLCCLSLIIRIFAQRWLLEKHERGLHLAGGILRTATWWIFLVGFVYSIFNIKVPYIPTPKEDVHENYWKLSLPNFIIIIFCSIIILYGLSIDWSPYSMAMAFYAMTNVMILGYIVIMSQQKLLETVSAKVNAISFMKPVIYLYTWTEIKIKHIFHSMLQSGPVLLLVSVALVFLSYNNIDNTVLEASDALVEKNMGGFYTGFSANAEQPQVQQATEQFIHRTFDIIPVHDTLGKDLVHTSKTIEQLRDKGEMPLMYWHLPKNQHNQTDWEGILQTNYDSLLTAYAALIRKYSVPVLFNPVLFEEGDALPASPELIQSTWQYLHSFFNHRGISNITWVWTPQSLSLKNYYPGFAYVDWIGFKAVNFSNDPTAKSWHPFHDQYAPSRNKILPLEKPVLVTEFASVKGNGQDEWYNSAFNAIEKFPEIKGVVICPQLQNPKGNALRTRDFSLSGETMQFLKEKLATDGFKEKPLYKASYVHSDSNSYASRFVKGSPRKLELLIDGKPYYIKGVAYNTGHDWRDGNTPLTRRQLERDFKHIKEMGANTIRRYSFSMYDKNVLNVAAEYDLKVLYGFWFDPKVDYYRDSMKVKEYIEEALAQVEQFKDHKAVLAWSVGNETWGLLKKKFSKPYLTKVRESYMAMLEQLARRIHEIDPTRPVFSSMEHEEYQLAGEIVAFRDHVPSVDVIGINSYYKQQISKLNSTFFAFDSLRPYIVSEFGPNGYWEPRYNKTIKGSRMEDDDHDKAKWYQYQWNEYVEGRKGYNAGGFAYCWLDRLEGSYTWFGLSDHKGRLKPSYYALKEVWTHQQNEALPTVTIDMPKELIPGKEYSISTITNAPHGKQYEYEWLLLKNEYMAPVDDIEPSENGRSVTVKIPNEPSNYRLYLFVSDGDKKVTTASAPIRVY